MGNKLNKDLLRIGILNFIFSILFLIFSKETDLIERLFGVLAINAGYFIFYFVIGRLMLLQVNRLKRNNNKKIFSIQKKMADVFARSTTILAIFIFLIFLFTAYRTGNYSLLFAAFLPVGIYLGGMRLRNGLREMAD